MDVKSLYELESIKYEFQGIVDELRSISRGIRTDFEGIGNEICANRVQERAEYYAEIKRKLNKIDTSAVTEEFKARQEANKPAPKAEPVVKQIEMAVAESTSSETKTSSEKKASASKTASMLLDALKGIFL